MGSSCVKERWKYHLTTSADPCVPPNPSIHVLGILALVSTHIQILLGSISTSQSTWFFLKTFPQIRVVRQVRLGQRRISVACSCLGRVASNPVSWNMISLSWKMLNTQFSDLRQSALCIKIIWGFTGYF